MTAISDEKEGNAQPSTQPARTDEECCKDKMPPIPAHNEDITSDDAEDGASDECEPEELTKPQAKDDKSKEETPRTLAEGEINDSGELGGGGGSKPSTPKNSEQNEDEMLTTPPQGESQNPTELKNSDDYEGELIPTPPQDEMLSTPPQGELTSVEQKINDTVDKDEKESTDKEGSDPERIYVPRTYDVLFGRGRPLQKHPGNLRFHKIVNRARETYLNSRKEDKAGIARRVMNEIKISKTREEGSNELKPNTDDGGNGVDSPSSGGDPGRFLKKVGDTQTPEDEVYWVEVTEEVAIEKISHALRGIPRSETRSRKDIATPKPKRKGPPSPPTAETALNPVPGGSSVAGAVNVDSEGQLTGIGVNASKISSSTSSFNSSGGIANQGITPILSLDNQQEQAVLIASLLQQLQQIQTLFSAPIYGGPPQDLV